MSSNASNSFHSKTNSLDERFNELFTTITAEYSKFKESSHTNAAIFRPSFSNRHAKAVPLKPELQIERIISITDQLQALFLLFTPLKNQPQLNQSFTHSANSSCFTERNNELIVEIVAHIGSVITSHSKPELLAATFRIDDQYKLYLRYAQLITNLSEKSSIIADSSSMTLNKLVDFLIEAAFFLTRHSSINQIDSKQLAYEIYRSLGSLIYQNGFKLNVFNLNRLLGENDSAISSRKARQELNQKDGLLLLVRERIEQEIELTIGARLQEDDVDFELNSKLNLITTQLIFNLTMPSESPVDVNERDAQSTSNKYIDDKFKVKVVYLLLKILRFHNEIIESQTEVKQIRQIDQSISSTTLSYSRQFCNEQNRWLDEQSASSINHNCKVLTKCLQGLENLIASIRKVVGEQQPTTSANNWLQSNTSYFQLCDILNTAKVFCTYGIFSRANSSTKSSFQDPVSVGLKSETNQKATREIKPPVNTGSQIQLEGSGHFDKPAKPVVDSNELSWRRSENQELSHGGQYKSKRYTKTSHTNKSSYGCQQYQQQAKQVSTSLNNEASGNHTNSVQCLREVHVPLVQYQKEAVLNDTDSDISDTNPNSSSKLQTEKSFAKIRIAAFGVLLTSFQSLDKRSLLSYWDSFLVSKKNSITTPGTSSIGTTNYSLIWSIRNDISPKVRLIASHTLTVYLEHAKTFFTLTAAEELSQPGHASLFIPISLSIARLIRELHRELLVSLCNLETFSLNQIQLLKCLQALIRATPYTKLKPGLIYKLVLNLNCFLKQKTPDNRNGLVKINQNNSNLIAEILRTVLLLLTNYHDVAEVHLALLSPIVKEKTIHGIQGANEVDQLSTKLEQLSTIFKVPNVTQSRVTYFYTSDAENTNTKVSSLSDSQVTSGQLTPLLNDLILGDSGLEAASSNSKSWLVQYCLLLLDLDLNAETGTSSINNLNLNKVRAVALELLQIICKKYFDLLRKDLFFDDLCRAILDLIELGSSCVSPADAGELQPVLQKALKLLEEFARCLATDELIARNNIDLSDCCRFWLMLLNSRLVSQLLCDEQYYLLSSSACDCLASIGASIFELLPFQKRIYCLTNLLHLTKSKSTLIRSSSVRALGVYVTFTSLKEDQTFLNDLSQSLQDLLTNDTNNLVRQKTAWSLSNLSEVLVENRDKLGKAFTDEFNLNVWLGLLDTASHACLRESDKLKSYLVRTLGNLISYITVFDVEYLEKEINRTKLENSIGRGIESLCQCRYVKMLKVKWNLSHAIGVSMRKFSSWKLQLLNPSWLQMFYNTLLDLFTESTNFKVRINACIALMTVNIYDRGNIGLEIGMKQSTGQRNVSAYSQEPIYLQLWISLIGAFSKLYIGEQIIDESNEVQHKASLVHQLCKFVTYLCKYLRLEDMDSLLTKCLNNVKQSNTFGQNNNRKFISSHELRKELFDYIRNIFKQIETNKQDVQLYNEALTHLNLLNSQKETSAHEDCINYLIGLLQKSDKGLIRKSNEESESSEIGASEQQDLADLDPNDFMKSNLVASEFASQFPNFKKTYD